MNGVLVSSRAGTFPTLVRHLSRTTLLGREMHYWDIAGITGAELGELLLVSQKRTKMSQDAIDVRGGARRG